ncbi:hypothetical protein KSD_16650 [Ktedonobacter sp. SOSP1-85]|nr:hypothetical protein KSD_16650 [Ktedonobacter sp. SOSP1-85]
MKLSPLPIVRKSEVQEMRKQDKEVDDLMPFNLSDLGILRFHKHMLNCMIGVVQDAETYKQSIGNFRTSWKSGRG